MSLGSCPPSPNSCSDSGIDLPNSPTPNPSSSKIPILQRPCRLKGQAQLRGCQGEGESPLISPLPDTSAINLEYPFQESRDIPSPPKKQRLRQSGPVNEGLEPFGTGWSKKLSFGDGGRIYDGGKQSHIKNGKEIEGGDPCAEYLEYCGGTDARLKRKIGQRVTSKSSFAFSDDYAGDTDSGDKHLDEMFDLAIRSIDLDKKISMVQRRKKSAEMSLMSLESFDAGERVGPNEAALEEGPKPSENFGHYVKSENFKKQLQSTKELKEKAGTSLKFLEKLSGEVEGLFHDYVDEVESSAVDTSSMSASWERNSEYKVDPEKEREVKALEKKGATVKDKLSEVSPTLAGETLYPRDTMATHFTVSSSHGNDAKRKSKHVTFKDAEDKRSDLPSSELDHVSADISELEKTTEEENLTQTMSEVSKSYRRIKKHLIVATGQKLMKDFIELFQSGNGSDEEEESCDDFIDEELIKETAEIVRRAMIHLDTDVFNDALQQASEAALGLTSEDTKILLSQNTKSLPFKSPTKNRISTNWAQAYPQSQIQATDLIRAIEILVCLTRSNPDFNAMLKDTPESEYDALAVHIIYYLDMCTNAKCLEIIEGRKFCGMEVERVQVPSFGTWWRRAQEEMGGRVGEAWGKGILSKSVLQNVNVDEGKWD